MDIDLEWINKAIDGDKYSLIGAFTWSEERSDWNYWDRQYRGEIPLDISRLKEMRAEHFPEYREEPKVKTKPKTWGEMTPEEKGALLLAHHEGKPIENTATRNGSWIVSTPYWASEFAYRVKPHEPKVEKVTGHYWRFEEMNLFSGANVYMSSHRITFNLIDGVPDCTSIKMEPIE